MVIRERKGFDFYAADSHIQQVIGASNANNIDANFRLYVSVYGSYDAIVVVESPSVLGIHQAVSALTAGGGVYQTVTMMAVNPEALRGDIGSEGVGAVLGVYTQPQKQMEAQRALKEMGFIIADVVFGEFDVVALFPRTGSTFYGHLFQVISNISSIRKTTTMLPHHVSEGESRSMK
jgi:uncharacterized protein with GYD domain